MHQETYSWYPLELCYSTCGPQASNMNIPWNFMHAGPRVPPQVSSMTTRPPGVSRTVKSEVHLG